MIDELHFLDIQGDQRESESGVSRSLIPELYSLGTQRDKMEDESGVT